MFRWRAEIDPRIPRKSQFFVIYPQQRSQNNSLTCFSWFGENGDPASLVRGRGENQSVASMVEHVVRSRGADRRKVFATGFSAGGAFAAVMLATWPDLFAAGAINSGLPYRCATSLPGAYQCMSGADRSPRSWGDAVRAAAPDHHGPYPRVAIWHGTADTVVQASNLRELMEQWTDVHGLDQTPEETAVVNGHRQTTYGRDGQVLVTTYELQGAPHMVAIDPDFAGPGDTGCGAPGSYFVDVGICAAYEQARFFGLDATDRAAPTVEIHTPSDGETLAGRTTVRITTGDDQTVTQAALLVDGAVRQAIDHPARDAAIAWDARREENGVRRLSVRARDAAGNEAEAVIEVRITGGVADTRPPVLSATPGGGQFRDTQTVRLHSNEPATIYYTLDGRQPDERAQRYERPVQLTTSARLLAVAIDAQGNRSPLLGEQYERLACEELASATCTDHYRLGRLDVTAYLACGNRSGFLEPVPLCRIGSCWSSDPDGASCTAR